MSSQLRSICISGGSCGDSSPTAEVQPQHPRPLLGGGRQTRTVLSQPGVTPPPSPELPVAREEPGLGQEMAVSF